MSKLKNILTKVADAAQRPAEGWRLLRQAVRELHAVLQGAATLLAEFEARLERLEAGAAPAAVTSAPAKHITRARSRKAPAADATPPSD